MRSVPIVLIAFFTCLSCSQHQDNTRTSISMGESRLLIVEHLANDNDNVLFINLHENERTSIRALKVYSKDTSINYMYIAQNKERHISFKDEKDNIYCIDPNRIFTKTGRKMTLEDSCYYGKWGEQITQSFAQQIIKKIQEKTIIVAVHNNTDENYSIKSYLPNGAEAQNTKIMYINHEMDPDDFIYTTDEKIYLAMVANKINVILQDNEHFVDDGSLSIYCGMKGIRYVNIETEHGHLEEQLKLIKLIHTLLGEQN